MKLINDFSFGLFFFQIAIIIVLILLLKKFAWGPILTALEGREEGIRKALEAAEIARIEMDKLQSDNQKLMREAREERDQLLKEARAIKDKIIADASTEAQEKADGIIVKAQEAIVAEKQAAMADLKAQVAELSIDIAAKVIETELDDKAKQMQLVDNMLKDVKLN